MEDTATQENANINSSEWMPKQIIIEEHELHRAIIGHIWSLANENINSQQKWSIPDTDSEDEFPVKQQSWAGTKTGDSLKIAKDDRRSANKFNLPSDSDEENPYSTAKSPTMSIKSAEPPIPPPVSTIPRNFTAMPGAVPGNHCSYPDTY